MLWQLTATKGKTPIITSFVVSLPQVDVKAGVIAMS